MVVQIPPASTLSVISIGRILDCESGSWRFESAQTPYKEVMQRLYNVSLEDTVRGFESHSPYYDAVPERFNGGGCKPLIHWFESSQHLYGRIVKAA